MGLSPISIGASLLGGLFGKSKASKERAMQREFAQKGLGWRVEDARKHGLHGLVGATGQSAQYQPTGVSPMGDAAADIASQLGNEAMARRDARDNKSMNAKQEQLLDAQIGEARSRTLLNQANAKRAMVGPGAPADPFAMRTENALVQVQLENGEKVLIPNPDVYEIGPGELVTGRGLIEAGRGVSRARAASKKYTIEPTRAPKRRKELSKHRRFPKIQYR